MLACPSCRSPRVHRSRCRSAFEQLRRRLTRKRPFRCHACGWRGWGVESEPIVTTEEGPEHAAPLPDFDALDDLLKNSRQSPADR